MSSGRSVDELLAEAGIRGLQPLTVEHVTDATVRVAAGPVRGHGPTLAAALEALLAEDTVPVLLGDGRMNVGGLTRVLAGKLDLQPSRVKCQKCGAQTRVRKDGNLARHKIPRPPWGGPPNSVCPGSGAPVERG